MLAPAETTCHAERAFSVEPVVLVPLSTLRALLPQVHRGGEGPAASARNDFAQLHHTEAARGIGPKGQGDDVLQGQGHAINARIASQQRLRGA